MPPITTPTLAVIGTSSHSISYGTFSDTVNFEITNGDTRCSITTIANTLGGTSDLYGVLTITFVLENDRSGLSSIKCLYSTGGESGTYTDVVEYTGGSSDGTDDLTTTPAGVTHTFDIDSVNTLGIDFKGTIWFKIRAFDRVDLVGDFMESEIRTIFVDNAPEKLTITQPTADYFTKDVNYQIKGTIPNPRAGNSNLHIKVEIASDSSFSIIEKTFESAVSTEGWEYFDDTNWVDLPVSGIPVASDATLIGNEWRLTIPTEESLIVGDKFVRGCAGGILI